MSDSVAKGNPKTTKRPPKIDTAMADELVQLRAENLDLRAELNRLRVNMEHQAALLQEPHYEPLLKAPADVADTAVIKLKNDMLRATLEHVRDHARYNHGSRIFQPQETHAVSETRGLRWTTQSRLAMCFFGAVVL